MKQTRSILFNVIFPLFIHSFVYCQINEKLDLSNSELTSFPNEYLENLDVIKSINLSDNNLETFPNEILEFIYLEGLGLKNNNIEFIPYKIMKLHNLKTLDLRGTNIKSLPKSIKKLHKLKTILMFDIDLTDEQKNKIKCAVGEGCEVRFSKKYREYPPYDCNGG